MRKEVRFPPLLRSRPPSCPSRQLAPSRPRRRQRLPARHGKGRGSRRARLSTGLFGIGTGRRQTDRRVNHGIWMQKSKASKSPASPAASHRHTTVSRGSIINQSPPSATRPAERPHHLPVIVLRALHDRMPVRGVPCSPPELHRTTRQPPVGPSAEPVFRCQPGATEGLSAIRSAAQLAGTHSPIPGSITLRARLTHREGPPGLRWPAGAHPHHRPALQQRARWFLARRLPRVEHRAPSVRVS